jgi:hypothetical protein
VGEFFPDEDAFAEGGELFFEVVDDAGVDSEIELSDHVAVEGTDGVRPGWGHCVDEQSQAIYLLTDQIVCRSGAGTAVHLYLLITWSV